MKKTYMKPEIMFDDFSLSTSIAVGCELVTPSPSYEANCGYPLRGGEIIFVEGAQCDHYPQDGVYNTFCYHVPTDSSNLFNS